MDGLISPTAREIIEAAFAVGGHVFGSFPRRLIRPDLISQDIDIWVPTVQIVAIMERAASACKVVNPTGRRRYFQTPEGELLELSDRYRFTHGVDFDISALELGPDGLYSRLSDQWTLRQLEARIRVKQFEVQLHCRNHNIIDRTNALLTQGWRCTNLEQLRTQVIK